MAVLIPVQGGAISSGQIINGVANFWQPTAPTTRVGGAALVDNDLWYDSSTGRQWIRKGIYWVSPPFVSGAGAQGAGAFSSGANVYSSDYHYTGSVFVESATIAFYGGNIDQVLANHWDISLGFIRSFDAGLTTTVLSLATDTYNGGILAGTVNTVTITPNSVFIIQAGPPVQNIRVAMICIKTGASTNQVGITGSITYRLIYGA